MNPLRHRKSSLPVRSAYTLLELMLALALLGALMTVAWSLMGTFRDAEQRGWKLSHRTQTIRAAREWLQSDIQHLLQNEPSVANSPAIKSRLNGNTLGFTASIAPSLTCQRVKAFWIIVGATSTNASMRAPARFPPVYAIVKFGAAASMPAPQ